MQTDVPAYALVPNQVTVIVGNNGTLRVVVEHTIADLDILQDVRLGLTIVVTEDVGIVTTIL